MSARWCPFDRRNQKNFRNYSMGTFQITPLFMNEKIFKLCKKNHKFPFLGNLLLFRHLLHIWVSFNSIFCKSFVYISLTPYLYLFESSNTGRANIWFSRWHPLLSSLCDRCRSLTLYYLPIFVTFSLCSSGSSVLFAEFHCALTLCLTKVFVKTTHLTNVTYSKLKPHDAKHPSCL